MAAGACWANRGRVQSHKALVRPIFLRGLRVRLESVVAKPGAVISKSQKRKNGFKGSFLFLGKNNTFEGQKRKAGIKFFKKGYYEKNALTKSAFSMEKALFVDSEIFCLNTVS